MLGQQREVESVFSIFLNCCKARYCVGICFEGVCSECFRYVHVSSSQSARNLSSHSWSFTATSSLQSTCDEFALPVAMNCELALKSVGSASRSQPDIDWISLTISLCLPVVTTPSVQGAPSATHTALLKRILYEAGTRDMCRSSNLPFIKEPYTHRVQTIRLYRKRLRFGWLQGYSCPRKRLRGGHAGHVLIFESAFLFKKTSRTECNPYGPTKRNTRAENI